MSKVGEWAQRWGVPRQALQELAVALATPEKKSASSGGEDVVQSQLRIKAASSGWLLWRNNVGAFRNGRRYVRYGLANDSKQLNSFIKSSDLIGLRPVCVTPDMLGATIGQFVAIEVKSPGWELQQQDDHTQAQRRFLDLVRSKGGYAKFNTGGDM